MITIVFYIAGRPWKQMPMQMGVPVAQTFIIHFFSMKCLFYSFGNHYHFIQELSGKRLV